MISKPNILKIGVLVLAVGGCGSAAGQAESASGLDARVEECEQRWEQFFAQHGPDGHALFGAWPAAGSGCEGTGVYEYRLASAARMAGDLATTIRILEDAQRDSHMPFADERLVLLTGSKFDSAMLSDPLNIAAARSANGDLEALLKRRPDHLRVMTEAARQRGPLGDYPGAAELANQVLLADPQSWAARRILVVAFAEIGRCADAKVHIRPAIEISETLLSDYEFMLAAAFCYLDTGDVLTAEQALLVLQSRSPSVETDVGFQNIARSVQEAKAKNPP